MKTKTLNKISLVATIALAIPFFWKLDVALVNLSELVELVPRVEKIEKDVAAIKAHLPEAGNDPVRKPLTTIASKQ